MSQEVLKAQPLHGLELFYVYCNRLKFILNAEKFILKLRQFVCRFALNDLGIDFSSFGYLKVLPVDYIKIDDMFVKGMVNDPIDHAMVKSINEVGHVMGADHC